MHFQSIYPTGWKCPLGPFTLRVKYTLQDQYTYQKKYTLWDEYTHRDKYFLWDQYTCRDKYTLRDQYNHRDKYTLREQYTLQTKYTLQAKYTLRDQYIPIWDKYTLWDKGVILDKTPHLSLMATWHCLYPPSTFGISYESTHRVNQYRWWNILSPTPFVYSPLMIPYMERIYTPRPKISLHIRILPIWEIKL